MENVCMHLFLHSWFHLIDLQVSSATNHCIYLENSWKSGMCSLQSLPNIFFEVLVSLLLNVNYRHCLPISTEGTLLGFWWDCTVSSYKAVRQKADISTILSALPMIIVCLYVLQCLVSHCYFYRVSFGKQVL